MSNTPQDVSTTELSVYVGVQVGVQIVRVPLFAYFLFYAIRYIRKGESSDTATALTFLFLSAQLFIQTSAGVIDFLMLGSWATNYLGKLADTLIYLRLGLFFSQNMALFINLGRWLIILRSLEGLAHLQWRKKVKCIVGFLVLINVGLTAAYIAILLLDNNEFDVYH